jgi:hypothetical protein
MNVRTPILSHSRGPQVLTAKWYDKTYIVLYTNDAGEELKAAIPAKSIKDVLRIAETLPSLKEIHGILSPQATKVLPQ